MGKLKKVGIFLFLALGASALASCNKETEQPPIVEQPPVETVEELTLSSITLDTTNTKTKYYLGEVFTADGLKVTSNFVKYVDGSPEAVKKDCTDFYLNTEEINMNKVGDYPVEVIYRVGTKKVSNTYTISVKSSLFDESNVKYASGLEIKYSGTLDLLIDDTFTFRTNALTAKVHYFQNGAEVEDKAIAYTKINIDYSAVDTSKVGTYLIKYSYSEPVVINGVTYENEICSFSIVSVSNPIQSIELVSGTTTLPASVSGIDTSDWKIKITKTKGDPETVDYTDDMFVISDVVSFITGPQTAIVKLAEDTDIRTTVDLTIIESTTHDIVLGTEFANYQNLGEKIQLDASGLFFVSSAAKVDEARTNSNGSWKDSYNAGLITFHARTTIKGTSQPFEVVMNQPGMIVLYIASTGSTERDVIAYSPEGEELETFTTLASTQIIQVSISVDTAGTYKFVNPVNGCYIHGCVIATEKVN